MITKIIIASLSCCALGCFYFLFCTFRSIVQLIKANIQGTTKGKITKLISKEKKYDGKKAYTQYIYEFSPIGKNNKIDFFEKTPINKNSELSIGMALEIFFNEKSKLYESVKSLKNDLLFGAISSLGFAAIVVIGCLLLVYMI